jgi:hypothetical protein
MRRFLNNFKHFKFQIPSGTNYTRNGVKSRKGFVFIFLKNCKFFKKIKTNPLFPVAARTISNQQKSGILPRFMYNLSLLKCSHNLLYFILSTNLHPTAPPPKRTRQVVYRLIAHNPYGYIFYKTTNLLVPFRCVFSDRIKGTNRVYNL